MQILIKMNTGIMDQELIDLTRLMGFTEIILEECFGSGMGIHMNHSYMGL